MKRPKWEPNYSHLLAKEGHNILLLDLPTEHLCKCGVTFMGVRNARWCPACKPAATAKSIARSQAKQAKKRAAARLARRGAA